ncbi:hypothetical protein V8F06_010372 [Rhypophila decipiens]
MPGSRPLTASLLKRSLTNRSINFPPSNIMCGGTFYQLAPDGSRVPYQYHGQRGIHVSTGLTNSSSTNDQTQQNKPSQDGVVNQKPVPKKQTLKQKTMAMLDEELRLKMEGLAGDGGESGVEYEDGKPVAMKRSVKENMFRYI